MIADRSADDRAKGAIERSNKRMASDFRCTSQWWRRRRRRASRVETMPSFVSIELHAGAASEFGEPIEVVLLSARRLRLAAPRNETELGPPAAVAGGVVVLSGSVRIWLAFEPVPRWRCAYRLAGWRGRSCRTVRRRAEILRYVKVCFRSESRITWFSVTTQ